MRVPRNSDTFDVYDAKAHPSDVIKKLKAGKEITITRNGSPVAMLVPVRRTSIPEKRASAIQPTEKPDARSSAPSSKPGRTAAKIAKNGKPRLNE